MPHYDKLLLATLSLHPTIQVEGAENQLISCKSCGHGDFTGGPGAGTFPS